MCVYVYVWGGVCTSMFVRIYVYACHVRIGCTNALLHYHIRVCVYVFSDPIPLKKKEKNKKENSSRELIDYIENTVSTPN